MIDFLTNIKIYVTLFEFKRKRIFILQADISFYEKEFMRKNNVE